MSHCELGEKATFIYSFKNKKEDKYITNKSPVRVKEEREGVTFNGGQCKEVLYGVDFEFGSGFRDSSTVYGAVGGIRIRLVETEPNYYTGYNEILCQGDRISGYSEQQYWLEVGRNPNQRRTETIKIIRVTRLDGKGDSCGDLPGTCKLFLYSNTNDLIHFAFGDSPCNWEVVCGDSCPNGFLKCKSTNHPGYCCIPCNEIKAELIAARLAIRSLKNG